MEESEKGASTSKKKEKMSLLDEDISKEFLSSWKSISVTDDDSFNFDTVTKGNKKAYDFGKLDMDFSLEGELDMISSFKVDMPGLDFSAPSKKSTGRSEWKSVEGNHQGKQDSVSPGFYFNELDDFFLESPLNKGGNKSNKEEGGEEFGYSNKNECCDSEIQLDDDNGALKATITKKTSELEDAGKSASEILISSQDDLYFTHGNNPSKSANLLDKVESMGVQICDEKTLTVTAQETDQLCHIAEKTSPKLSYCRPKEEDQSHLANKTTSKQSSAKLKTHDVSVQTLSGNHSTQAVISEQMVACSLDEKLDDGSYNIVDDLASYPGNMMLKDASSEQTTKSKNLTSKMSELRSYDIQGKMDCSRKVKGDLDTSATKVSRMMPHETYSGAENQIATSKLVQALVGRSLLKDNASAISQSKIPVAQDKSYSSLNQAFPARTKLATLGRNKLETVCLGSAAGSKQNDIKLTGNPIPHASKGNSAPHSSEGNTKDHVASRERCHGAAEKISDKLGVNSKTHDGQMTNHGPVLFGSEKNLKDDKSCGLEVQSSISLEWVNKHSYQDCEKLKPTKSSIKSIQNLKVSPIEGSKLTFVRAGMKMLPDLSRMKSSRTIIAEKNHPASSTGREETKSLGNSDKIYKSHMNSNMCHSIGTVNQASITPSFKRKTSEASDTCHVTLPSPKRLIAGDNRGFKEVSKEVVEEAQTGEHLFDRSAKHVSDDLLISTFDLPCAANVVELGMPLSIKSDINVQKAEAFTKGLEDLCSTLERQHEEAKELLVRAIVNDNNLLLLNHPIYQPKIILPASFVVSASIIS
ncbi:hypothetical protein Nepgr_017722 [Nepenthes gracilis]|uniref:Uncharacterized protein n=1 Tax=Nepenthes gracilis TaxID=150966 RepID=A0AAD3SSJ7_NEPGR|nr:hypothetical protein Nepgr_017722 [Nepenthes gracilis]